MKGLKQMQPSKEDLFSLSKTLPKDDTSEEDSRSGTSTDEDGEPLIPASAHPSNLLRSAVLEAVEKNGELEFDWAKYDTWSAEEVSREFARHVEQWGKVEERALPDWDEAKTAWDREPRKKKERREEPRKEQPKKAEESAAKKPEVAEQKKAAVEQSKVEPPKKKEEPKVEPKKIEEPKKAAAEVVVGPPVLLAPSASSLPPVGAVPAALVPELDLDADIDYATLPVLPEVPAEAPSIQQTRLYKNYMKLRYEWQRRHPERDLPKVVSGWYKDGKPSSADPAVKEATEKASEKLKAAVEQLKAAKEGALPVVKVTHRMSMSNMGDKNKLSRTSDSAAHLEPASGADKKERRFSGVKSQKRHSTQSIKTKKGEDMPDEMQL